MKITAPDSLAALRECFRLINMAENNLPKGARDTDAHDALIAAEAVASAAIARATEARV